MKTFKFLSADHNWKKVGRKRISPRLRMLPLKHLYVPTMLDSFIQYVDLDVYQQLRDDFLKGRFYFLENNDEYAYMFLFDIMNGYPENALNIDIQKLNDELGVLRRLSKVVDDFFNNYINNSEYKEYLRAEKKGVSKIFVEENPNTFRFPYIESIEYESIDRNILPRDHEWKFADERKALTIERVAQPLFTKDILPVTSNTTFNELLRRMDNADWKEYNMLRKQFLAGHYCDLTYKPSIALHLMYDFMGGQEVTEGTDQAKLNNELWVLGQCSDIIRH